MRFEPSSILFARSTSKVYRAEYNSEMSAQRSHKIICGKLYSLVYVISKIGAYLGWFACVNLIPYWIRIYKLEYDT